MPFRLFLRKLCLASAAPSPAIEDVVSEKELASSSSSSQTYTESLTHLQPGMSPVMNPTTKLPEDSLAVQQMFMLAYPQYQSSVLDAIRETEYKRLGKLVYLDYTGATLYPESLVQQSHDYLNSSVLGNPHSTNPA